LPETGSDGARQIAERLRERLSELEVPCAQEAVKFTVSVGVATWQGVDDTLQNLLQRADTALYEAKRLGRNCALLHTGRGRFRDGKGRLVETDDAPTPQVPQIFA
jgi:two-component system cell cycle response regulator